MRKRKEIKEEIESYSLKAIDRIMTELLLDIRELLIIDSPYMQRLNLAKVRVVAPEETVNELIGELNKKYAHFCDACHVEMNFLVKYENQSKAEFHTYQCPKCRGKIDFAQIEGVGEFSVHSNLVPKEAKEK